MTLLDGQGLAKRIRIKIKKQAQQLPQPPGLAVIIVGDNPASHVYVANKEKDCTRCGFVSFVYRFPDNTNQAKLLELIQELNERQDVHGILVQLPLPTGYNTHTVIQAISPDKDVDAFHAQTIGRFYLNQQTGDAPFFQPCTPAGVMALLDAYNIEPKGKNAVVVGHSNIVGKPMATMLLQRDATVTNCHVHTADLGLYTRLADILVVAVGKKGLITANMVKPGAVVVDVGITQIGDALYGDVDFDGVSRVASYISPVPGGVGPMTRAMLMRNTLAAAEWLMEK